MRRLDDPTMGMFTNEKEDICILKTKTHVKAVKVDCRKRTWSIAKHVQISMEWDATEKTELFCQSLFRFQNVRLTI